MQGSVKSIVEQVEKDNIAYKVAKNLSQEGVMPSQIKDNEDYIRRRVEVAKRDAKQAEQNQKKNVI
jgi:hypothetical protein